MSFIKNKNKQTKTLKIVSGKSQNSVVSSLIQVIFHYFYHESKQKQGLLYSLNSYTLNFIIGGEKYIQSSHGHDSSWILHWVCLVCFASGERDQINTRRVLTVGSKQSVCNVSYRKIPNKYILSHSKQGSLIPFPSTWVGAGLSDLLRKNKVWNEEKE